LSFFALNSAGYLNYYGPEQTTKKVAYTLARMRAPARRWLGQVRLNSFIAGRVYDTSSAHHA